MKKTVVSFLLAAVMGLSSPAGSLCIPEEEHNGTMEQEQNEEGEFEGLELEEEPEIKVEEDTEEEMQGDASSKKRQKIRRFRWGKATCRAGRYWKNLQEPFLLRIMQTVFLGEIHRKMNS